MNTARDRAAIGAEVAREEGRGPAGQASAAAKNAVTGRGGGIAGENPYAEGYMGAPVRPPGAIPATTPYDSNYRPGFTGDRRGEYDGVGGGVAEGMGTGLSGDRRGEYDGVGGGVGQGMGTGLIGDRRSKYDGVDRGVGHGMGTEMATGVTGPVESTKFELDRLRNRTVVTGEGDAYAPTAHQLKDLVSYLAFVKIAWHFGFCGCFSRYSLAIPIVPVGNSALHLCTVVLRVRVHVFHDRV